MGCEGLWKCCLGPTIYLLNTPIVTSFGMFRYTLIDSEQAQKLATWIDKDGKRRLKASVVSAIGHKATAEYFSALLGVEVPVKRRGVIMETGDKAIVLRCLARLPEGKVLSLEEMGEYAWQLTLLEKISEE